MENFLVLLRDGSTIAGKEATKKVLRANDSLRPEWYVRRSFLETRYWLKGKKKPTQKKSVTDDSKASEPEESKSKKSIATEDQYVALLEQTNADLRAQNTRQLDLISKLTENQEQSNILIKSLTDLLKAGELTEGSDPSDTDTLSENSKSTVFEVVNVASGKNANSELEDSAEHKEPMSIWQKDLFWFINDRFR